MISHNTTFLPLHNITNTQEDKLNGSEIPPKFVIFVVLSVLGILLNIRVMYIVMNVPSQKQRSVEKLVANLSFATILNICSSLMYMTDRSEIYQIRGKELCKFQSFALYTLTGVLPLNIAALMYEQVRKYRNMVSIYPIHQTILFIWIAALMLSVPSFLTTEYDINPSTNILYCKQIDIFGMFEATVAFECFRFLLLHLVVPLYIIYELCKIHSTVKYLSAFQGIPQRISQKVEQIRYVYCHSGIFLVLWVSIGVLGLLYRLSRRGSGTIKKYSNIFLGISLPIYHICSILNPIIYLLLLKTSTLTNLFFCHFKFANDIHQQVENTQLSIIEVTETPMGRKGDRHGCRSTAQPTVSKWRKCRGVSRFATPTSQMSRFSTILEVSEPSETLSLERVAIDVHSQPNETLEEKVLQGYVHIDLLKLKRNCEKLI